MFGDLNRVELLGNVTMDPELKYTTGGTAVLNLGLATNRRVKKGDEWTDETDFHNIVIWGNLAMNLSSRIRKGTRLFMAGVLRTRSWDGQDGKKNYRTEVHVYNSQDLILIARYEGAKEGGAPVEPKATKNAEPQTEGKVEIDPDDLPF